MKFTDYYSNIKDREQRRNLRNRIVEECKIQQPTFYFWFRKHKFPPLPQEKIAKILNLPQSELFPKKENEFI